MAQVDIATALRELFLDGDSPSSKPDVCEAVVFETFLKQADFGDAEEARKVLKTLFDIMKDMEWMHWSDGTINSLIRSIARVAEAVGECKERERDRDVQRRRDNETRQTG